MKSMKRYRIAAVLMIIHGALMEIGGCIALLPLMLFAGGTTDMTQYFSFIVPYFQQHLYMMLIMGGIYGTVRVIGAVALLKNRLWGLVLSIINCIITMALMMFMLPAGIVDGILACSALVLMLSAYFEGKRLVNEPTE